MGNVVAAGGAAALAMTAVMGLTGSRRKKLEVDFDLSSLKDNRGVP